MQTKTCVKCGEEKTLDNFYRNSKNRDLFQGKCKPCHNQQNKQYRNKRNKLVKIKPSGYKGYETYVNDQGITCCKNFDVYNLGARAQNTITPLRGIEVRERFKIN